VIRFWLPLIVFATASYGQPPAVGIRGDSLLVNGSAFVVKGVHYGPWRPGTGPNKGYPYPAAHAVEPDLKLIRKLNANTILVVDAPAYVLDVAAKYNLKVLYTMYLNWWTIGTDRARERADLSDRVNALRTKAGLLAWDLGNEIPPAVIQQRGQRTIEAELAELYRTVKALDPLHPITHSNWPVTKDLDLGFFDIASFNVYPLWPPEVVAQGYQSYIRNILKPLAGGKPLLITEFGANTLEAGEEGEARLLLQCWKDLRAAGACGGVVFEFADEWWKNYDNPRRSGAWWDRESAVDDEKTHDQDPEEYYGILTAERRPKAAAHVVEQMFAGGNEDTRVSRIAPALLVSFLLLLAVGGWVAGKRRARTGRGVSATVV
jgi:hypothetical protein